MTIPLGTINAYYLKLTNLLFSGFFYEQQLNQNHKHTTKNVRNKNKFSYLTTIQERNNNPSFFTFQTLQK